MTVCQVEKEVSIIENIITLIIFIVGHYVNWGLDRWQPRKENIPLYT